MTLFIPLNALTAFVSFNTPNITGPGHYMVLTSQYDNKDTFNFDLTAVTATNRYSEFLINITEADRTGHYNGIYNYELRDASHVVIESGLIKYTTEEGGSLGTTSYQSNNENREAVTYFRPEY